MQDEDRPHNVSSLDAVRLLCDTIQNIHHLDKTGEGIAPSCKDEGEAILQDALFYLAHGDTHNAGAFMQKYEIWKRG